MRTPILLLPLLLIAACGKNKEQPSGVNRADGPAQKTEYAMLTGSTGKRVVFKTWVLAEGESFRSTGDPRMYYFILGPEPEIDWSVLGQADEDASKLQTDLSQGSAEGPAGSNSVAVFNRCSQTAGTFGQMFKDEENKPEVLAWGVFTKPPLGTQYGLDSDSGIPYLANPTRGELLRAAKDVSARIDRLLASAELEVTGTNISAEQFIKEYGEGGETIKNALQKKQVVVKVDSFKVLRTGRDLAAASLLKKRAGQVK